VTGTTYGVRPTTLYLRPPGVFKREGERLCTLTGHSGDVTAVTALHNGKIVTGSRDWTAKVWTQEGECLHTLVGHSGSILAVVALPNGLIVTGSRDKTAKIWTQEGVCLRTLTGHADCIRALTVLSDGVTIVTGGGRTNAVRAHLALGQGWKTVVPLAKIWSL